MNSTITHKNTRSLIILLTFTYMISYITRTNYAAVISEIQRDTGISNSLLSMAVTGSFFTYAFGQIIAGILGDRLSPKKLIMSGMAATSLMNLLIPVCQSPYQMLVVWSINGFAQAFMWPPILKMISSLLSDKEYSVAVVDVSYGGCIGTIAVYLLSPVLITVAGWRSVFFSSAAIGFTAILIWFRVSVDTDNAKKADTETVPHTKKTSFLSPLMLFLMLAIILHGMLRDGVTTWMPTFISERYNISNRISILTGVVLPILHIICYAFASRLYAAKIRNPISCAAFFFAFGALSACGIVFLKGSAVVSVVLMALLIACMHGVNLMFISFVPSYFKESGRVSTVSGILNACTYIGAAVSTYGFAILSEKYGWSFTIISWLVIAVFGTVICFLCGKRKSIFSRRPQ